jgi:hypothetical protein
MRINYRDPEYPSGLDDEDILKEEEPTKMEWDLIQWAYKELKKLVEQYEGKISNLMKDEKNKDIYSDVMLYNGIKSAISLLKEDMIKKHQNSRWKDL